MNVLVVEPSHWGHRLNAASLLLDAVARLPGAKPIFVTANPAVSSEQYKTWIEPRLQTYGIHVDPSLKEMPDSATWRDFKVQIPLIRAAVLRHDAGHVLIPSGDALVQMAFATRLFSSLRVGKDVEYEAMMLRGRFAYEPCVTLREKLARTLWFASVRRSPFDAIHHMDPIIYQEAIRRAPDLEGRLKVIPDPVDPIEADITIAEARKRFNLPAEGRIAGCVGVLDLRKGMDLLLWAFARCIENGTLSAERDRLLLVGKQDAAVASLLANEMKPLVDRGAIVSISRFVSDVEMSNAITAMDLVVTPYPKHIGSASIVIRAAAQRRPVLASDFGWLGTLVRRLGLGSVCDVLDPAQFAEALPRAFDAATGFQPTELAQRFVSYSAVENFQAHWVQRLARRLGLTPPPVVRWQDVIG